MTIIDIWEYARENIELGCHVSASFILLRHDFAFARHVFRACAQAGRVISDRLEEADFADLSSYFDPVDGRP